MTTLAGLLMGVLLRLPGGSLSGVVSSSPKMLVIVGLVIAGIMPFALFASLGRGYLLPLGLAIILVMAVNLVVYLYRRFRSHHQRLDSGLAPAQPAGQARRDDHPERHRQDSPAVEELEDRLQRGWKNQNEREQQQIEVCPINQKSSHLEPLYPPDQHAGLAAGDPVSA